MRISELIDQLNDFKKIHGDIFVFAENDNIVWRLRVKEMYDSDTGPFKSVILGLHQTKGLGT